MLWQKLSFFTSKRMTYVYFYKIFICWLEEKEGFCLLYNFSMLINEWDSHVSHKDHTSYKFNFLKILCGFTKCLLLFLTYTTIELLTGTI